MNGMIKTKHAAKRMTLEQINKVREQITQLDNYFDENAAYHEAIVAGFRPLSIMDRFVDLLDWVQQREKKVARSRRRRR